jgi:hypothetical protein
LSSNATGAAMIWHTLATKTNSQCASVILAAASWANMSKNRTASELHQNCARTAAEFTEDCLGATL